MTRATLLSGALLISISSAADPKNACEEQQLWRKLLSQQSCTSPANSNEGTVSDEYFVKSVADNAFREAYAPGKAKIFAQSANTPSVTILTNSDISNRSSSSSDLDTATGFTTISK